MDDEPTVEIVLGTTPDQEVLVLRQALAEAVRELREQNLEYNYVTSWSKIVRWARLAGADSTEMERWAEHSARRRVPR
jgi:hypothetical protein